MSKPVLLDLFCGAGGASRGYANVGFDVIGVDAEPQANYPYDFHQGDWREGLERFIGVVDVIHASPPCQTFTAYKRRGGGVGDGYLNLIPETRQALIETRLPYVIENVPGAPLLDPIRLCGSSFGLDVRRHRLFESNLPMSAPACNHGWQLPRFPGATNRKPNSRRTVEIGVYRIPLSVQQEAMGIDWMKLDELSQAIPPAYTEHVGIQLANALELAA